jgi:hypothetical protein
MKTQHTFIFTGFLAIVFFSNANFKTEMFEEQAVVENSSNPPLGNTGAPGESSCVSCHSGSTLSATGVVDFNFGGTNNLYVPGQTYTISISSTGNAKNGFQMTALDESNNAAGTFTAGTASSVGTANARRYIRHSVSNATSSWTFQWTAPAESQGEVTFYYAYARANGAGGNTGDQIYLGNATIQQDISSDISVSSTTQKAVEIVVENREIRFSYSLPQSANIYFCIQDLSGKQMAYKNYGTRESGINTSTIALDNQFSSGIYICTLFIDNRPFTTKIFVP